jgi:hypothetical protein
MLAILGRWRKTSDLDVSFDNIYEAGEVNSRETYMIHDKSYFGILNHCLTSKGKTTPMLN